MVEKENKDDGGAGKEDDVEEEELNNIKEKMLLRHTHIHNH